MAHAPDRPAGGHRREIDGLRAVAVLPVILFHAGFAAFAGGYLGVDVFFVISGYLITGILAARPADGRFSIARFYERRARRILPALIVVLLACIPFGLAWLSPLELRDFARGFVATALSVSNVLFWQQLDYFGPAAEHLPLLHTWSLGIEEQFYLLFPLAARRPLAPPRRLPSPSSPPRSPPASRSPPGPPRRPPRPASSSSPSAPGSSCSARRSPWPWRPPPRPAPCPRQLAGLLAVFLAMAAVPLGILPGILPVVLACAGTGLVIGYAAPATPPAACSPPRPGRHRPRQLHRLPLAPADPRLRPRPLRRTLAAADAPRPRRRRAPARLADLAPSSSARSAAPAPLLPPAR